jgi:hypothetical protein
MTFSFFKEAYAADSNLNLFIACPAMGIVSGCLAQRQRRARTQRSSNWLKQHHAASWLEEHSWGVNNLDAFLTR